MPIIQAIVLGLIQGLTEFIPVSSSGHLVLTRVLFGWEDLGVAFDTILHLGTLLAIFIYFFKTWKKVFRSLGLLIASIFKRSLWQKVNAEDRFLLGALFVGTIPVVLLGFFGKPWFDNVFRGIYWVSFSLLATGVLFLFTERFAGKKKKEEPKRLIDIGWLRVIFIGCMQAIALFPGVSRSGTTISGGVFSGLSREKAARFSFMLSAPAIFGAGIIGIYEIFQGGVGVIGVPSLFIGFFVSLFSSYFAVSFMLKFLRTNKLYIFSIYLIILGSFILLFNIFS